MRYEFIVAGQVSDEVMASFPELSRTSYSPGASSLFGPVRDRCDVMSILARFTDLGLDVVEMRRLPD